MPVNKELSSRKSGRPSGVDSHKLHKSSFTTEAGTCAIFSHEELSFRVSYLGFSFKLRSALFIESTALKPLLWTAAQSCQTLKLRVRLAPLMLYSDRNESFVIKLSYCNALS